MSKNKHHNLSTVISFEFIRTIKKPSFWIATLSLPLIFIVVFALSYYSTKSSTESLKAKSEEKMNVLYSDESGIISPEIASSLNAKKTDNTQQAIEKAKKHKIDAYIEFPKNLAKDKIEIYAKDTGIMENSKYSSLATNIAKMSATAKFGNADNLKIAKGDVNTELTAYEKDGSVSPGIWKILPPGIFLVIFYFLIVMLGSSLLNSTVEEKENRVTEMILTSIKPKDLIVGKIIAMLLAGVLQAGVILLPLIIGYIVIGNGSVATSVGIPKDFAIMDMVNKLVLDPVLMTVGALLLIGSIIMYTGLLVSIGAIMPTAKEANQWFSVIIISMFLPFYLLGILASEPENIVTKILTFFPLTAPISAMVRNAIGNLTVVDSAIVLAILFIFGSLMVKLSVQLFRQGAMEYDNPLSIKRFFK